MKVKVKVSGLENFKDDERLYGLLVKFKELMEKIEFKSVEECRAEMRDIPSGRKFKWFRYKSKEEGVGDRREP